MRKILSFTILLMMITQPLFSGNFTIGGYGQVDYNQDIDADTYNNGKLDVHRVILLVGYQYNPRTKFVGEFEFEHVKELYVEQAYLSYKLNKFANLDAGLMLIPMGHINLYHESPAFNGVERPIVEKYIAPTTWREIGAGLSGNLIDYQFNYKLYLVNGFNGYDGTGKLNGKNGLRSGRQKGAESYISSPNISGRIEYYGLPGTKLGLSGYFGKTQSTLYDGIAKDDNQAINVADSSVVGVSMVGLDFQTNKSGFQLRGQFYYTSLSNTQEYNHFAGSDLGSSMIGYYLEGGYDLLRHFDSDNQLISFVRYDKYNTQADMTSGFTSNDAYNNQVYTLGLTWKVADGAAFKCDYQFKKSEASESFDNALNAGIAIMF